MIYPIVNIRRIPASSLKIYKSLNIELVFWGAYELGYLRFYIELSFIWFFIQIGIKTKRKNI